MRRTTGARAGRLAAACLVLAAALPAHAQTYRCTAANGRTTYQQTACDGSSVTVRGATSAPAAKPAAPPSTPASAAVNPACAETSTAILGLQAEVRRLEAEGESRAVGQAAFLKPGDNIVGTLPNMRQLYGEHIAKTKDDIETLRRAARSLGCPTH